MNARMTPPAAIIGRSGKDLPCVGNTQGILGRSHDLGRGAGRPPLRRLLGSLVNRLLCQTLSLGQRLLGRGLAVQNLLNGVSQSVHDAVESQINGEPAAVARDL